MHRLGKAAFAKHTTIADSSVAADVHVQKFIFSVRYPHQNNTVRALIIVECASWIWWCTHDYVFAIDSPDTVGEIPWSIEFFGNRKPLCFIRGRLQTNNSELIKSTLSLCVFGAHFHVCWCQNGVYGITTFWQNTGNRGLWYAKQVCERAERFPSGQKT